MIQNIHQFYLLYFTISTDDDRVQPIHDQYMYEILSYKMIRMGQEVLYFE